MTLKSTENRTTGSSHQGSLDPDALRSIAETRAHMGDTIEEIHGRLNPTVFKEEALEQFQEAKTKLKEELTEAREALKTEVRSELTQAKEALREATIGKVEHMVHSAQDTVKETGHSLADAIKENPIPAALTGIGLAWLFLGTRAGSAGRRHGNGAGSGNGGPSGTGGTRQSVSEKIGETASDIAHTAQKATGDAVQGATEMAHQVKTTIGETAHRAGEAAEHLAAQAGTQGKRLGAKLQGTFRDNPLAVGAAVMAAGTAVALAIPISNKEKQLMGETQGKFMQKAEKFAHGALEKADDATEELGAKATKALGSDDPAQHS
jgi:cell division septum initiation protein DivIVA